MKFHREPVRRIHVGQWVQWKDVHYRITNIDRDFGNDGRGVWSISVDRGNHDQVWPCDPESYLLVSDGPV